MKNGKNKKIVASYEHFIDAICSLYERGEISEDNYKECVRRYNNIKNRGDINGRKNNKSKTWRANEVF